MDVDLEACLSGDKDAWDALVERLAPVIYSTVTRAIGRREGRGPVDIDDCVQDIFVRLVRHDYRLLRTYDPDRAALTTWVALISRSVAIDHLRKRRIATVPVETAERAPAASDPPPPTSGSLEGSGIPLHLLTPRQRLVVRLLFEQGLSVGRAAALVGVDEQTIRSTKHKALTRLREHLDAGDAGADQDV